MTEHPSPELPAEEETTQNQDDQTLSDLTSVETQLAQQAEEIVRLKDQYLRAMAETENVRARAKRDMEENTKYATTKFARDMVNIVENLGRASQSISEEARAGSEVLRNVGEGLDMSMQELLGIFERHGIKRINPVREKFDHNYHQAVAQVESNEVAPGTVVSVLQAGYALHDRLLRPAMVSVSTQAAGTGSNDTAA